MPVSVFSHVLTILLDAPEAQIATPFICVCPINSVITICLIFSIFVTVILEIFLSCIDGIFFFHSVVF